MKQVVKKKSWLKESWKKWMHEEKETDPSSLSKSATLPLSPVDVNYVCAPHNACAQTDKLPNSTITNSSSMISITDSPYSQKAVSECTTRASSVCFTPPTKTGVVFSGIPSSRIALINHNQKLAFRYTLLNVAKVSIYDQNFYFKWNVWRYKSPPSKELSLHSIIETHQDLHMLIKNELAGFLANEPKLHLFRMGLSPFKKYLNQGYTIEFKVDKSVEEVVFKEIATRTLSNNIYSQFEPVLISICGLTIKRVCDYSNISIWIHPIQSFENSSNYSFIISQVTNIIGILKNSLTPEYEKMFETVILIDNANLEPTLIETE